MGYLTTITIHNDGADQIKNHSEEFSDGVYRSMNDIHNNGTFSVGNFINLVTTQRPRHSSDPTIYVHLGNTVTEMNAFSSDTDKLAKENPEFFEKLLREMIFQTKALKRIKKNNKDI